VVCLELGEEPEVGALGHKEGAYLEDDPVDVVKHLSLGRLDAGGYGLEDLHDFV